MTYILLLFIAGSEPVEIETPSLAVCQEIGAAMTAELEDALFTCEVQS